MRYRIEDYDKNGFLKPSIWLWLGWLFIAKAWVVFIVASASRDMSSRLLELIYPIHNNLYLGLAIGAPVVVMAWLIGLRHPERAWVQVSLRWGRELTMLCAVLQFALTLQQLSQTRWLFNWVDAITLLGLGWFLFFMLRSRRVKDTFAVQKLN